MGLRDYIINVPKVELHVHLEGSMPPETLLELARKHQISLPANTVSGVNEWFKFVDMPHFVDIYITISNCLQTAEDIEQLAKDFLRRQAEQNVLYTEITYTPYTHYHQKGISFREQLNALNRARVWAEAEFGVTMRYIFDIAREVPEDIGLITAQWVIDAYQNPENRIAALGLGGYEIGHPPEKHAASFAAAREAGVPIVLHAGEHGGPDSVRGAIALGSQRIGHGVRAIEDAYLVRDLVEMQIPLEISPTSNLKLKVFPSLAEHAIQPLIEAGVNVTLNSDDPPMFNTTLTDEFLQCADTFGWSADQVDDLILNAARAALISAAERAALEERILTGMAMVRAEYLG
ncbi:MAG: adenosine deaminase [Chloroflexi bacterium OLB15]|nr:MAG: adenosine deaminase [Chloroflexi bacterium OLB15]